MNSTPDLDLLEQAARELALAGYAITANRVRQARPKFAALLDAVADKFDEADAATHGLSDSPADSAMRVAYTHLRPSPCPK